MGLIKNILKKFSCKSSCKFNEQEFDINLFDLKLSNFELKNKDMLKISSILSKRNIKPNFPIRKIYTTSSI